MHCGICEKVSTLSHQKTRYFRQYVHHGFSRIYGLNGDYKFVINQYFEENWCKNTYQRIMIMSLLNCLHLCFQFLSCAMWTVLPRNLNLVLIFFGLALIISTINLLQSFDKSRYQYPLKPRRITFRENGEKYEVVIKPPSEVVQPHHFLELPWIPCPYNSCSVVNHWTKTINCSTKYVTARYLTRNRCQPESKFDLFLLIHSDHTNYEARKAIRSTYGRPVANFTFGFIFILGRNNSGNHSAILDEEVSLHGDILQGDFDEHYDHLTLKTIIGFRWILSHCGGSVIKYVTKTDDDIFFNILPMLQYLRSGNLSTTRAILGRCFAAMRVRRDPTNKWYIARPLYTPTTYPPYCAGLAYTVTWDLVIDVTALLHEEIYLRLEDAFFGIAMSHLSYQPHIETSQKKFVMLYTNWCKWSFCHKMRTGITFAVHSSKPELMYWFQKECAVTMDTSINRTTIPPEEANKCKPWPKPPSLKRKCLRDFRHWLYIGNFH